MFLMEQNNITQRGLAGVTGVSVASINNLLNKNKLYYIICDKGIRSKQMVKFLLKKNYNVIYVKKGICKLNRLNL